MEPWKGLGKGGFAAKLQEQKKQQALGKAVQDLLKPSTKGAMMGGKSGGKGATKGSGKGASTAAGQKAPPEGSWLCRRAGCEWAGCLVTIVTTN